MPPQTPPPHTLFCPTHTHLSVAIIACWKLGLNARQPQVSVPRGALLPTDTCREDTGGDFNQQVLCFGACMPIGTNRDRKLPPPPPPTHPPATHTRQART